MTNIDKREQTWAIPKLSYQDIYPFEWPVTWRNEPSNQWGMPCFQKLECTQKCTPKGPVAWSKWCTHCPGSVDQSRRICESLYCHVSPYSFPSNSYKDQRPRLGSQSAWTTKLLRKSFCVTVHDESGHKRNMGMQILQCECCESLPEWRKNVAILEANCHIPLSISTGDGTAHSSWQRNIMIHSLLCFMDTMKDDALLLFRKIAIWW